MRKLFTPGKRSKLAAVFAKLMEVEDMFVSDIIEGDFDPAEWVEESKTHWVMLDEDGEPMACWKDGDEPPFENVEDILSSGGLMTAHEYAENVLDRLVSAEGAEESTW